MIIDKDTGKVYDIRNERAVDRLTINNATNLGSSVKRESEQLLTSQQSSSSRKTLAASAWGDWWKEKKKSNDDYLAAAQFGNLEKLKRQLNPQVMAGMVADVNAKGLDNWHALHFAANGGHEDIVKELVAIPGIEIEAISNNKRTPMHIATSLGKTSILKILVEKGADPNCRDDEDGTPLHYASQYGMIGCLTYLLTETKADPFLKNKYGYIASDIAMNLETRETFSRLVKQKEGIDFDKQNHGHLSNPHNPQYGRTAFNGVLRHNDRVNMV